MPNKYLNKKGIEISKQKYRLNNWSGYNKALISRGDIEVWLSQEVIDQWYRDDRVYDGTGTPDLYTDLAIITCHEIRKVFRLPLRQCQGFINSIFRIKDLSIRCPNFSTLSKRLDRLGINAPRYRKTDRPADDFAAIAIDTTGLKCFGKDEWHQEKHGVLAQRKFVKLHVAVDNKHFIQGADLTDRFTSDSKRVEEVFKQIRIPVNRFLADGAYDKNPIYDIVSEYFKEAEIVIPPVSNAAYHGKNHSQRNHNILVATALGRMIWQKRKQYGFRNYSELAIQRYKRILGNNMQSREFARQRQEAMIGCGILNKMTNLGMPESYRVT